MKNYKNLLNKRFERLTIKQIFRNKGYTKAICVCSCGTSKEIFLKHILSLKTKSCGCLQKENRTKHSMSKTDPKKYKAIYSAWKRCYDINCSSYISYGGRGIKFDDSWLLSNGQPNYVQINEDVPNSLPGLQLDRINNNGNYSKLNVRWATVKEQANNRRNVTKEYSRGFSDGYRLAKEELNND